MNKKVSLSVIVPVFNEEATVKQILQRLLAQRVVQEIIVVNDGSTDGTEKKVQTVKDKKIKYFRKENGGKGSAIRFGLEKVTKDYVMIQDADLEYDPEDISALLEPIKKGKNEIVYGSRFLGPHLNLLFWHRMGNAFLNFVVNILYNTTLSDMETCYKVMPTKLLRSLNLRSKGFDIEPEITCKLLRSGYRIYEVPISYVGRDFSEGKKITWKDGIGALRVIFGIRLLPY
ncbi:MAG: glycosyltransferase family 2 protein [Patescibacteria group bacterium]